MCQSFIKSTNITSEPEIRVNICGSNVLLQYQIRAVWKHRHTEILIEIPAEKYKIGQGAGLAKIPPPGLHLFSMYSKEYLL